MTSADDDKKEEGDGEENDAEKNNGEKKIPKRTAIFKMSAQDRAGVKFPISRLAKFAKKGKYADRIGQGVPVYMAGILEYLTFELLELASNKAG